IEMIPTGGVNLQTVTDFFSAGSWAVGVGSELVDPTLIREKQYSLITERAGEWMERARSVRNR
ncbi:MAG: 2-dehydro-3-deoxyphosphogluconate aldolase, partial [Acidobacteriaceae bacterium]|nr:2-dehydro-3-deoxyphosphogluconate aldolase [Acidobacteriaceae bacterium]MBV9295685.1 2-dehydro-3-deoxyphosphogluconate aldolase [Acidobacteriaceae bacterium]